MSLQAPFNLKAEYLKEEVIVDHPRPRFFWNIKSSLRRDVQTAYQIILASEPEFCQKEIGDLWDSGRIESSASSHIPYE